MGLQMTFILIFYTKMVMATATTTSEPHTCLKPSRITLIGFNQLLTFCRTSVRLSVISSRNTFQMPLTDFAFFAKFCLSTTCL